MKKVVLRESQAPYTLIVDNETLTHEEVILERDGEPIAALVPINEYEAFRAWREMMEELLPEEPPHTPEGDLEALAAVERIRTMFADVDPEVWRDVVDENLFDTWLVLEEDNK
ncbi:MAG: hypothetical protein A2Z04_04785 [Chloroflexi bacterium RBG_16_57_9]|nr:MAG: hypothetical protein A2Z04_04785 [Chloroflexi bacterium RBG_16_57_9]